MKLGLMTAAFADLTLEEIAAWASANGYEMLEPACWPVGKAARRYAGVTHIDVANLDDATVQRIQGTLTEHRLAISSLGYYPNPMHPDPEHRDEVIGHLKQVIQGAARLGVPTVGTFVGRDKSKTVEESLADFERIWPPIVAFAESLGVNIAIENCPMIFSNDEWPGGNNLAISPSIWRRMFEIIPSPNFGLNLDPSHLIWQMIDAERVVHEFADRILHVHAKDLRIDWEGVYERGITSLGMGWQIPRIPGFGDVDWARFLGALVEVGYDGVVSVEHEDRAFEGSREKVERGFLVARDVLRPYLH